MKHGIWLTSLAILTGCASTSNMPDLGTGQQAQAQAYLQDYIRQEMSDAKAQGLSIAIVDDQGVRWAQGFGWADREHGIAATEHTQYRAGSLSKLLTDVAALQLVALGRLDIDAPVQRYLPDFAPKAPDGVAYPITSRALMTHHSGLPRDVLKGFMSSQPDSFERVPQALNELGADDVPQRSFSYSNAGLSVLGCVISRVVRQPFEGWMQSALLAPLDMQESAFEARPGLQVRTTHLAQGYADGVPAKEPGLRDVPAGGLTTTVYDMAHFMRMMLAHGEFNGQKVLPAQWVQATFTPQNTQVPLDVNFPIGLGWMLGSLSQATPQGVGTVAHHAGATRLFHAQMYVLPDQHIGVVVMANDQNSKQLVDRVALRALAITLQVKAGIHATTPPQQGWASPEAQASAAQADVAQHRWSGLYGTFVGPVLIDQSPGQSPIAHAFGKAFDLRLRPDGTRSLSYSLLGLVPVPLGDLGDIKLERQSIQGLDALVGRLGATTMLLGTRVQQEPVPAAWSARIGDYDIINSDEQLSAISDLKLVQDGGHLYLQFTDSTADGEPQRLLLRPRSDLEAQVLQLLPDAGPMISAIPTSAGEALAFGGYRAIRRTH
jgi:CubicO group peptidase (beta-lactamase class C family)